MAAREWAQLNPKAYLRDPITAGDVLASPMICEPLRKLDCCLVTDGGGAVVIAAEDRWADVATRPVAVLGHGETHTHATITNMPDLTVTGAAWSGRAALRMAGVTHEDIDLAEMPFTVALVDLDEGVRMMTRIIGAPPGTVHIGQRVRLEVAEVAGVSLPCFRPAD